MFFTRWFTTIITLRKERQPHIDFIFGSFYRRTSHSVVELDTKRIAGFPACSFTFYDIFLLLFSQKMLLECITYVHRTEWYVSITQGAYQGTISLFHLYGCGHIGHLRAPAQSQIWCHLWMSTSNSDVLPILPSDGWKANPKEAGDCMSAFKKRKKHLFKQQHYVLACGNLSIIGGEGGGGIVYKLTVSYWRHLNLLLYYTTREAYNYFKRWCLRELYMSFYLMVSTCVMIMI